MHSIQNSKRRTSSKVHSFTFTVNFGIELNMNYSVELDRAALNRETLIENVDDVKAPLDRFFHQLLAITFDSYSTVLRTIFQVFPMMFQLKSLTNLSKTFDNILTSYVLEQKGSMRYCLFLSLL